MFASREAAQAARKQVEQAQVLLDQKMPVGEKCELVGKLLRDIVTFLKAAEDVLPPFDPAWVRESSQHQTKGGEAMPRES